MLRIYCTVITMFIAALANGQTIIKLSEVSLHIGDSVTVCGNVAGMRYFENSKGQPTLLNIGAKYPDNQLTVYISGDVRSKFTGKLEELQDKQICITGRIILYKEKPEIIIEKPGQITVE